MITEKAFAKINLTLSVGKKRKDGYHDIDSVMHSISLYDKITLEKSGEISLSVTKGSAPSGQENLMWKAAELFFAETGISGGVRMELEKHIPAQAGLGGGSSDAAAVLRGLNRLMKTGLSAEELSDMGKRIGADVPFCITGGCCRCRGIGEKLTKVPGWDGLPLVIVRPSVAVETGKAYAVLDRAEKQTGNKTDTCIRALEEKDIKKLAKSLSNDFEKALFAEETVLEETSRRLALFSRPLLMTGSGSAFFVIAESRADRKRLAEEIKKEGPGLFVAEAETKTDIG
ncbi:MAG: 4-(cytidine 5'-diphospho)-2-C-methyl-D-erythritol kinase [Dialister sp.]|nr:4-(cytidine 5'-diphospho)-2-C-methyl-D-erythritol kinase [Dialister sp.]